MCQHLRSTKIGNILLSPASLLFHVFLSKTRLRKSTTCNPSVLVTFVLSYLYLLSSLLHPYQRRELGAVDILSCPKRFQIFSSFVKMFSAVSNWQRGILPIGQKRSFLIKSQELFQCSTTLRQSRIHLLFLNRANIPLKVCCLSWLNLKMSSIRHPFYACRESSARYWHLVDSSS